LEPVVLVQYFQHQLAAQAGLLGVIRYLAQLPRQVGVVVETTTK
jgi:hypothetical protein